MTVDQKVIYHPKYIEIVHLDGHYQYQSVGQASFSNGGPRAKAGPWRPFKWPMTGNYRTDASITPSSSKAPPPSFEQISELAMHASISPPQN